jgi:hypothetical protein
MSDQDAPTTLPPPAEAQETAVELFRALGQLHAEGKIALSYDFKRLHHMDCPVAKEADGNIWAYAVLAAALVAWWRGGWQVALGVGVVGALAYYTIGQSYVRRRIRRRVADQALGSLDLWQKLWRFGGIGLVAKDGGAACQAPQGSWMALVRGARAAG